MEKSDYHSVLGLGRNATAAEIESSYLAISQFLDPQRIPPQLHRWAAAQSALADEAYAALTDTREDEEEEEAEAARVAPPARASRASAPIAPRSAVRRRRDDDYDYDDFDPDTHDYDRDTNEDDSPASDDYEVEQYRGRGAKGARRGQAVATQPKWQQAGRRRATGQPQPASYRRRQEAGDDRMKMMFIGVGVALLVLLGGYLAAQQYKLGPFSGNASQANQGDQPIPIDQARYNQLVGAANSNPQDFDPVFELGEMTFEAERYQESITWLEKALVLRPTDVWSLLDVGTASFNLGDRDKAFQMWQKALAVDPNNPQTHWNLGFYYASDQPPSYDQALQEWQKVMQLSKPADKLYQLAQTHIEQYKSKVATPSSGGR